MESKNLRNFTLSLEFSELLFNQEIRNNPDLVRLELKRDSDLLHVTVDPDPTLQ